MKNLTYILTLVTIIGLNACVDPLDVKTDSFEEVLVVEGRITTELGPHLIYITKSAKYGSIFEGVITPVDRADVAIRDNEGNTTVLTFQGNGLYATPSDFQAVIGKSYILNIEIGDKIYNSTPETVESVNVLDTLYTVYNEYPYLNENDILNYKIGVDVYANYEKQENTSNFYLWDYDGTHYIKTFPELYERPTRRGPVPAPKDCCADCYKYEENTSIIISSFPLGNNETDAKLFFLSDNGYRFIDKYVMTLKRYSLSLGAYKFYELIQNQLSIDGDIFDPPPASITGNIININDIDELVVGYFYASDVALDTLTIESSMLDRIAVLPIYPDDCRVLPNTTTVKPSFY
jgi:hypothetical protein